MTENEKIVNVQNNAEVKNYKDSIEDEIITLPFRISYVPKKLFKELDAFCKENFKDDRVAFLRFLWEFYQREVTVKLLDDKVDLLTANVQNYLTNLDERLSKLEEKPNSMKAVFGARSKEKAR